MTASVPSAGSQPDAAASLTAIEEQQRRAACALRPSALGMFLPWGVAYFVGFGAAWLGVPPHAVLPLWLVIALAAASFAGATVSTAVTLGRSARGIAGRSRRLGAMYGWSFFAGFAAMALINLRLGTLGVPATTMSLAWSASALLVVGLLYLAGGMLFGAPLQYALGIWILVSAVAAVWVGYPANLLVLALAGGGGFVVLGVVTHVRGRVATA